MFPDDTLYYNIAKRLIADVGGHAYDLASEAVIEVQNSINAAVGVGLKAVSADAQDKAKRLMDITNAVSGKPYKEAVHQLTKEMKSLPLGAAGSTMEQNIDFQGETGLRPKIVRTMVGGCCKWCADLARTYAYPEVKHDAYRRHPNCRCTLEYIAGANDKGKSRTLWTQGDTASAKYGKKPKRHSGKSIMLCPPRKRKKADARAAARKKLQVANESDKLKKTVNPKIFSIETSRTTGSGAWSQKTKEHLLQSERIISGNKYETAIWYSNDGSTHWSKKGSAGEVKFTHEESIKMKGGVLTHNHPNGTVFSPEDIGVFANISLTEIRTCNSRGTYVIKKSASNSSGYETLKSLSLKQIDEEYWNSMGQFESYYADLAAKEGRPIFLYMQQMDEAGLTRFCEKYGLDFTWEVK